MPSLMDQPEEILLLIVKMLDYNDLRRLARLDFLLLCKFKMIFAIKS